METIFIINSKAGNGKKAQVIKEDVLKAGGIVYLTKAVGDGEAFVKNYCVENGPARFIACGGDGTLNEVVNGAMECEGAEIGVIPIGTGNDFCRNFDGDFFDIKAQMYGFTERCDVIKYTTEINGEQKVGYCANMFNIGFDCNVADYKATMQKYPFVSGFMAYFLSILVMLFKKKGADLTIEIDGEVVRQGPLLLTSIANGRYCGGGMKCNPLADVTDGLINMNLVYDITRRDICYILPRYMKGTHMKLKNINKYLTNYKAKCVKLTPATDTFKIAPDGEIVEVGATIFEIVPEGLKFVIPKIKEEVMV